jgi:hypothetical protein
MNFGIVAGEPLGTGNVLNMPTVRPLDTGKPDQAWLASMVDQANANIALYDGITEPVKKIIALRTSGPRHLARLVEAARLRLARQQGGANS